MKFTDVGKGPLSHDGGSSAQGQEPFARMRGGVPCLGNAASRALRDGSAGGAGFKPTGGTHPMTFSTSISPGGLRPCSKAEMFSIVCAAIASRASSVKNA